MTLFAKQPGFCGACGKAGMYDLTREISCSRICREELEWRTTLCVRGKPYYMRSAPGGPEFMDHLFSVKAKQRRDPDALWAELARYISNMEAAMERQQDEPVHDGVPDVIEPGKSYRPHPDPTERQEGDVPPRDTVTDQPVEVPEGEGGEEA